MVRVVGSPGRTRIVEQTAITDKTRFCWKCFKDNPKEHFPDGSHLWLCGGCGYDLRTWTNFLRANGLGIRTIIAVPVADGEGNRGSEEEGKDGVEGEGNLPANAKGRVKT